MIPVKYDLTEFPEVGTCECGPIRHYWAPLAPQKNDRAFQWWSCGCTVGGVHEGDVSEPEKLRELYEEAKT